MGFFAGKSTQQGAPTKKQRKKGGLITIPFIIGNETFEKVASFGLLANMMLYLIGEYHIKSTTGITIMFLWAALSNFTPVVGAFLSDSYLGRFRVIALGTLVSLAGMTVLLLTAIIPQATPPYCNIRIGETCVVANLRQRLLLFSSFALMSIGAGGIRPCSMAFGADQVDDPDNPNNERVLQIFFNWYYASVGISLMVALTLVVYIQDKFGWVVGFGVPLGLMLFSTAMFFLGSPFYVKVEGDKSLFGGFARVMVAAWKNRHLSLPADPAKNFDGWNYYHKGSKLVVPTDKLRFLNKACMANNKKQGESSVCTVRQVEELKALIKVLPIWSTGIIIAAAMSQHAVGITQALAMDRHVAGHLSIPAGSFGIFAILALTLWVALHDRVLVPLSPALAGHRLRMGAGLLVACAATATAAAAVVERERRRRGPGMAALWLAPQYALSGVAEALNAIGQIEFYYSQFPRSMASVAVALLTLGMGFGNLAGAAVVRAVNALTGSGGRVGWLDGDLDRGRYDKYYWVLTLMGLVNFLYFVLCSGAYGDSEGRNIWDDDNDDDGDGKSNNNNKNVVELGGELEAVPKS